MKAFVHVFALLAALLLCATAGAQTPDPRDYEIGYFVPSKTTIINTYLRHQSGTRGRNYSADIAALRATYILRIGDVVFTPFDAILPISDQRGYTPLSGVLGTVNPAFAALPQDLNLTLHASGVGDLVFLPTIGHGVTQNAENHTHTWYALTTYITAPTGKYDPDRLLNVGANRWTINPLVVVGQRFLRAVTVEAMANVAFYTANDEYRVRTPALAGRNLDLEQKPSFGGALHTAVDLHPMFFLGASYLLAVNGKREIELPAAAAGAGDMRITETMKNTIHTLRFNLGLRVTPQTLILAQWNEDVAGTDGAARGRFFGVRITHAFFQPASTPTRSPVTDPAAAATAPVTR